MIKTKVAFLEGRLLSSQSEQSERFSKSSDWLEKSHFCFDHVNRQKGLVGRPAFIQPIRAI